ncbi:hypothetical protein [Argonema galeatum]|nr:hypothetical protein [Argonema galeatum]
MVSYKKIKIIMLMSDRSSTTKKYECDRAVTASPGLSAHSGKPT